MGDGARSGGRSMVRGATEEDLTQHLFVAMSRLMRSLRRATPTPLGHSAVTALATTVVAGPLRAGDLAAREGVSAPTMTRIIAALETAGYVVRQPDPADGRASLVRATPEGEALITGNRSAIARVLRARVAALTAGQRAALAAALPALDSLADD
jgi:DNA-binding MarR family transcriptional regulator